MTHGHADHGAGSAVAAAHLPEGLQALLHGAPADAFAWLGRHGDVVRALLPGARSVDAEFEDGTAVPLQRIAEDGLFVASGVRTDARYRLRIDWGDAVQTTRDPYAYGTLLDPDALAALHRGDPARIRTCLGAHPTVVDGDAGVRFALWAPNATRVAVVGDFNGWDTRRHPMRLRHEAGIWELFVPDVAAGARYKFALLDRAGHALPQKADPCARATECPPATASVVADATPFTWTDAQWMSERGSRQSPSAPMAIYEVHAGSWMHAASGWDALAERLVPYVVAMGFTHIELLPVTEHPFTGSWGYQPLGLFAPSARYGDPAAFARFVDRCHGAGIGVLLDWVPAHFPADAHGIARFDGSALYEHADPREGWHPDWQTLIYNHGRDEVSGWLIASALEWLEHFHVDGLRVDAVASMLYRDYSRAHDAWIPNVHGGRENYEAVAFLRRLCDTVHAQVPGAIVIAEESTAWPGVTRDTAHGGLGFDYKWNMGWMHDSLDYIGHEPIHRAWHHDRLTFGLLYAFSEQFVLPISHDEVVHGKGSLLARMPGDDWQRFANLRAYLAFLWTHPGRKLLFMGCEFAQQREWNHDGELDWHLLDDPNHRGVQQLVRDLNALYTSRPALHAADGDASGFTWIVGDDRAQSIYAYLRQAPGAASTLVALNFTPVPRHGYRIGVPHGGVWRERLNSDAVCYGGSNLGNGGELHTQPVPSHGHSHSLTLTLPPLAALVLEPDA